MARGEEYKGEFIREKKADFLSAASFIIIRI